MSNTLRDTIAVFNTYGIKVPLSDILGIHDSLARTFRDGYVPNGPGTADAIIRNNDIIMGHIRANQKIQAIKEYRFVTGSGLMEAKNAVEAFMRSNGYGW